MLTKPKSDNINKYNELIYKWSCNSGETYLHFKNGTEYEWYMDDKNYYDINGTYTVKKDSDIYYITLNSKNRVTYGHKYTNTYQANYMLIFRGKYEFELKNVNINKTFQCKREN